MKHIVKRRGHTEPYNGKKLFKSIYTACLTALVSPKEAEQIARDVVQEVEKGLHKEEHTPSFELHHCTIVFLRRLHPETAYLYEHHKDIS